MCALFLFALYIISGVKGTNYSPQFPTYYGIFFIFSENIFFGAFHVFASEAFEMFLR